MLENEIPPMHDLPKEDLEKAMKKHSSDEIQEKAINYVKFEEVLLLY